MPALGAYTSAKSLRKQISGDVVLMLREEKMAEKGAKRQNGQLGRVGVRYSFEDARAYITAIKL